MSVDAIRDLRPGSKWDPKSDDVLVQVRGYLRDGVNLYLYATKDQALLDDISGIPVSNEGEGNLGRDCSNGFVELVARIGWLEGEQRTHLVPIKATRLVLRESGRAEEHRCWSAS
jgi:hypothetical protein